MTYEQAMDFIFGIRVQGHKPGLARIKKLLGLMGNPQDSLRFIHVAGTNGKGSTSTMLSHILCRAGYKTGLYISPYVVDFRERIQVNNQMIAPEELAEVTAFAQPFWQEMDAAGERPSQLEFVVALMFEHFRRQRCDIVVLEVGMGGRFDSTNAIATPLVSVITAISLDHTQHLGNTFGEIAYEKCGIIKKGGVTVCYPRQPTEALAVIMERAAQEDNRLFIPNHVDIIQMDENGSDIVYDGKAYHVPLAGEHQIYNAITALEVIRSLSSTSLFVTEEHIHAGLADVRFVARFESIGDNPLVVIDGAHNPAKMAALGHSLSLLGNRKFHAVLAMMDGKNVADSVIEVIPHCTSVIATTMVAIGRTFLPGEDLAAIIRDCYTGPVAVENDPEKAFQLALSHCGPEDVVLVCGSLYLAGALRPLALAHAQKQEQQQEKL